MSTVSAYGLRILCGNDAGGDEEDDHTADDERRATGADATGTLADAEAIGRRPLDGQHRFGVSEASRSDYRNACLPIRLGLCSACLLRILGIAAEANHVPVVASHQRAAVDSIGR